MAIRATNLSLWNSLGSGRCLIRIAVYEHMLPQSQLRFMLADDAGAGKTIMTGLYLREMLNRGRIRRALIVAPAGLLTNWQRELSQLFDLSATILNRTRIEQGVLEVSSWKAPKLPEKSRSRGWCSITSLQP